MTDGATGQVTQSLMGTLDKKSDHPRDVIPEADVVILCLPVHQYRAALDRLAPFLNRNKDEVFVGTVRVRVERVVLSSWRNLSTIVILTHSLTHSYHAFLTPHMPLVDLWTGRLQLDGPLD